MRRIGELARDAVTSPVLRASRDAGSLWMRSLQEQERRWAHIGMLAARGFAHDLAPTLRAWADPSRLWKGATEVGPFRSTFMAQLNNLERFRTTLDLASGGTAQVRAHHAAVGAMAGVAIAADMPEMLSLLEQMTTAQPTMDASPPAVLGEALGRLAEEDIERIVRDVVVEIRRMLPPPSNDAGAQVVWTQYLEKIVYWLQLIFTFFPPLFQFFVTDPADGKVLEQLRQGHIVQETQLQTIVELQREVRQQLEDLKNEGSNVVVVLGETVLREESRGNSTPILKVKPGQVLVVIEADADWVRVGAIDWRQGIERAGWIHRKYLEAQ
jgi:hypothetical protein